MTKFAKLMAVCGCCAGLALVGCQSSRSVDASGAECSSACTEKCTKGSTVDVQAGEGKCCGSKASTVDVEAAQCTGKTQCTKGSTVDVQASECTKATSCSGVSKE